MKPEPFILGVNYWPRRKAMFWWSEFDQEEVREEFGRIADLGMSMVRIFLLWEDFQPKPDAVSPKALDDLGEVCDIAAGLGLSLNITFFTGHMSGPSWVPGWMLLPDKPRDRRVLQVVSGGKVVDCAYRNPYHDSLVLDASELLVRSVVSRFRDHPAIAVWNLGNEPDLFAWPADAAEGRDWVRRFARLIKDLDPGHPVTCGLHTGTLFNDTGLRAHEVFAEVDFPVIHGYPMYTPWAKGPLDPMFVPFLCALVSALSGGRPTLMEEFGGATEAPGKPSSTWRWTAYGKPKSLFMAGEDDFAAHIEQVLPNLVEAGATGAVFWCWADYVPELWNRPPCDEQKHERFFGLVRSDGTLKPHAEVVRRFADSRPVVRQPSCTVRLDISGEAFYQDPDGHARRLYGEFPESG